MDKITELDMIEQLEEALSHLSPVELVEEYNRIMGTDLTVVDVNWGM